MNSLRIYLVVGMLMLWTSVSHAQGILFQKELTFEKAAELAQKENKLLFVDVYTDWCGPCKWMDANVFVDHEVGMFANTHFVNLKIDAEKGAGIDIAKKYGVKVYPTYLFIDPNTLELVHLSKSRQEKEVFYTSLEAAVAPEKRSVYLQKAYAEGRRDKDVILNYTAYLYSIYDRDGLTQVLREYFDKNNNQVGDSLSWTLFRLYIQEAGDPTVSYVLANLSAMRKTFGTEEVDKKLAAIFEQQATRPISMGIYNEERFDQAALDRALKTIDQYDFVGKDKLLTRIKVLDAFRREDFATAADLADGYAVMNGIDSAEILSFYKTLMFYTRSNESPIWISRALKFARYIAYNDLEERLKPEIHFNYASLFEKYIRLHKENNTAIDFLTTEPTTGVKEYTLRDPQLKSKPIKKK